MAEARKTPSPVGDEELIAALLQSGTVKEAGETLGLSTGEIYDRMQTASFQVMYTGVKTDVLRQATFNLSSKLSAAIDTVAEVMADESVNAATRLQASQTILNKMEKFSTLLVESEGRERDAKRAADKEADPTNRAIKELLGSLDVAISAS